MNIVGIDVAKARFDAALLVGERVRQSTFSNTETGFEELIGWRMRHRTGPSQPLHACLEARGNWGLDLADHLYAHNVQVGIVNPARIKADGASVLPCASTSGLVTTQCMSTGTA
jgi:transposase